VKIHEYQGKQIFAKYGIPVPQGIPCMSPEEAVAAAKKLIADTGNEFVVVKAQIHAGGRGKAGGVKVCKGIEAATPRPHDIFGKVLVTPRPAPRARRSSALVEQGLAIKSELYLALVVDRETKKIAIMASTEGGMDIEEVAHNTPEKIHMVYFHADAGLQDHHVRKLAFASASPRASRRTSTS
jgi:succinyl-CoA synthetase beta subunit